MYDPPDHCLLHMSRCGLLLMNPCGLHSLMKPRFVTDAVDNICPIHPPVEVAPTDMEYETGGKWPDHLIFE